MLEPDYGYVVVPYDHAAVVKPRSFRSRQKEYDWIRREHKRFKRALEKARQNPVVQYCEERVARVSLDSQTVEGISHTGPSVPAARVSMDSSIGECSCHSKDFLWAKIAVLE